MTDIDKWTCGCTYFLISQFNLYKHLVYKKGPIDDGNFFKGLKRNRQPPFLTNLHVNQSISYDNDDNSAENVIQVVNDNDNSAENMMQIVNDNDNSINKDSQNILYDELIESTIKALALLQEQKAANNLHWVNGVKKNFNQIIKMVEEVEQYRRRRTMPFTFKGHTHNTRFLN